MRDERDARRGAGSEPHGRDERMRLPDYATFVSPREGTRQRRWLNAMLRLTAKRIRIDRDIASLRATQARFDERLGAVDPDVRSTPVDCAGVRAEWIEVPATQPGRTILYLHGGAFLFRFPKTHTGLVGRWCKRLGARALMPDYRLAPEHRFPAGLDDCHTAYRWLLRQGADSKTIVIAGDSAGGNLALATLLRIRQAGEPLPACAVLLSPVVDFTMSGRSVVANAKRDPVFRLDALLAMRAEYAPPERFLDPAVSPLYGDFNGLPPLLFQVGSTEMLLDESTRAAAKAHASGVPVSLEIWDRMPHVFQAIASLPQAALATDRIVRFIAEHARWPIER